MILVTQEMPWDFTDAERFGRISFLASDDLHNTKGSPHNERLLADLRNKLVKFNPKTDWILVTGSPFISAAVFLILGHFGHRYVPILRWNNRDRRYTPLHMQLPLGGFKDDRQADAKVPARAG